MGRFGDILLQLRKENGYTLDFVARKARTHKGYISCIEHGKVNPPSFRMIRRMAQVFGVSAHRLLLTAYVDKAPVEIRFVVEKAMNGRLSSPGRSKDTRRRNKAQTTRTVRTPR